MRNKDKMDKQSSFCIRKIYIHGRHEETVSREILNWKNLQTLHLKMNFHNDLMLNLYLKIGCRWRKTRLEPKCNGIKHSQLLKRKRMAVKNTVLKKTKTTKHPSQENWTVKIMRGDCINLSLVWETCRLRNLKYENDFQLKTRYANEISTLSPKKTK